MNNKRRQRAAGGMMAILIGLLVACGGGGATAEPTAVAAIATAPSQATTAPIETTAASAETTAAPAEATTAIEATIATTATTAPAAVATLTKLNLNTVSGDELLATIPNFSSRMVREFEEYRPYVSIQQFRREIGKYVDEATVAGYEQYVYVPVDANNADEATLMQLPGVDATIAAALVAGRPYADNNAFLTALAGQVSATDAAAAAAYLATP